MRTTTVKQAGHGQGAPPGQLRQVQTLAEKERQFPARTDEAMRKARQKGATLRQLSEVTGFSPPTISRRLGRH